MKRFVALIACIAACVGVAASCSDSGSSSNNTTTTASRGFEVDTPDGQVSLSLSGQLPPNWPSDFPVPPNSEPAGSGSLGGSTSTGFVGVYTTSESPQDAYSYYLDSAGLTVTSHSSLGSGNAYVGTVQFNGEWSGTATVLPYNGETLIVIILSTETGTTISGGSPSGTSTS
jgi:hypothetical protein